jgi:hypothetical protein
VFAESFINHTYDEINKIADPYWVAQYLDAVSSSDEEDEEVPLAGVVATGSSSEDSDSSSGSDSDGDMTVGQLHARSDVGAPSPEP